MTAGNFKGKLTVIFSSASVVRLKKAGLKFWKSTPAALKAVATIVIALNAGWQLYSHVLSPGKISPKIDVASKEKMAFPLPDVPSIAVLPFLNMSGDPKQDFLSDGMTEAIITALSKVPGLFVIARNTTFTYKGKPVKIKQVSEELGVRYVLEGSLQRSGERVRITAQMIDALKGDHLWAERYDRDLKDIFGLQDEITVKILKSVHVKLKIGGELSSHQKYAEKYYRGRQGLDCYLKVIKAGFYLEHNNIENNNLARRMIEEVIRMCPEDPYGYIILGWVNVTDIGLLNTMSIQENLEKAMELAQKALAMDDSIAGPHSLLGVIYRIKKEYDKAIAEGERALALNPGGTNDTVQYASSLNHAGRPKESIPLFQKAIRINPFGSPQIYREFGLALRNLGQYEEAISALKKAIQLAPDDIFAHLILTGIYSLMGRDKEARAEAAEVLRINPKFSMDSFSKLIWFKDQSQTDKVVNALRKAGLK